LNCRLRIGVHSQSHGHRETDQLVHRSPFQAKVQKLKRKPNSTVRGLRAPAAFPKYCDVCTPLKLPSCVVLSRLLTFTCKFMVGLYDDPPPPGMPRCSPPKAGPPPSPRLSPPPPPSGRCGGRNAETNGLAARLDEVSWRRNRTTLVKFMLTTI